MSDTRKIIIDTENGQTLTLVDDGKGLTIRIAKDGHNRGIAKIARSDMHDMSVWLVDGLVD